MNAAMFGAFDSRMTCVGGMMGWLDDLTTDVRLSFRRFRRAPVFLAVTTLTLAIGLGANVALFGLWDTVFRQGLPFEEAERLVRLRDFLTTDDGAVQPVNMSGINVHALESAESFEGVTAARAHNFTHRLPDGGSERLGAVGIAHDWMSTMRIEPLIGRGFTPDEADLGPDASVALISHRLWTDRFGAEPGIVGRAIQLDDAPFEVVGVMPPGFRFPYEADVWVPLYVDPDGSAHMLAVFGRLGPGVTIDAAQRELDVIAAGLRMERPDTNEGIGLLAVPARASFIDDQGGLVNALFGAVAVLLLLTAVNVANVLVARFLSRSHEIGVSAALGASRFRQARRFMTETVLLFLIGGVAAVGVTFWVTDLLQVFIPDVLREELPLGTVRVGPRVALFALALSLACGLAVGVAAAARASRADVRSLINSGGRALADGGRRRMQRVLVGSQVALAFALLMGAATLGSNFQRLQSADLGFEPDRLLTLRINLQGAEWTGAESRVGLVRDLLTEIEAVPEVEAVGITTVNPICCGEWGVRLVPELADGSVASSAITTNHRLITPGLLETMEIPLLAGRSVSYADDSSAPGVVIVGERLAARMWPGEEPVGKRIQIASSNYEAEWIEVIGVVSAVRDRGDFESAWYRPYAQDPLGGSADGLHLMVRTVGAPAAAVPAVRAALGRVHAGLPAYEVRAMASLYRDAIAGERVSAVVALLFAGFGLVLVSLGIYGLLDYFVRDHEREIGVRVAFGARPADVRRLVFGHTGALLAAGLVVGAAAGVGSARILGHFLPEAGTAGPGTMLAIAFVVVAIVAGGSWIPARRATRLEPLQALRPE